MTGASSCHITISLLMVSLHASGAISVPPRPEEERKSEADINAFSSRNAILCLRARFRHLPGTWAGRLGAQTGPVNKSASGLNRGEAAIKLSPEANVRELSGNLTECLRQEISRKKTHAWKGFRCVCGF